MTELEVFIQKFDIKLKDYILSLGAPFATQMEYVLFSGGKRLRPFMVKLGAEYALGRSLSVDELDKVLDFAISVELIHTYSLVHDDMPCMDNDDFRRGKPTAHKKFGEWQALLLGDALLNLAFERGMNSNDILSYKLLSECAGHKGMINGQYFDLNGVNNLDELLKMYANKTSKLFIASLCGGALLFNPKDNLITKLRDYAYNLGIAFQIADDLLEEKTESQCITTYVSSDNAKEMLNNYTKMAINNIQLNGESLVSFAKMLVKRKK